MDNGWIMCSDSLPDKEDCYLVIWKTKAFPYTYYEIQEFDGEKWFINIPQASGEVEIIAWRELPEKPKNVERIVT